MPYANTKAAIAAVPHTGVYRRNAHSSKTMEG